MPYLDSCEKIPAAIELKASFNLNLDLGKLVRNDNMYSNIIAPKKKGTACKESERGITHLPNLSNSTVPSTNGKEGIISFKHIEIIKIIS